ncbi:MAG: AAA family ATPase [Myxococcota bacterium]
MRGAHEQSGLAVLAGPSGIGKSAIALRHLEEVKARRAVYLRILEGSVLEASLADLLAALGEKGEAPPIQEDERPLWIEQALDAAEASKCIVLVDDAHRWGSEALHDLWMALRSFAKQSRWIFTTASPPHSVSLAAHAHTVVGLDEETLLQIADAFAPTLAPSERRRACQLAAGSPWLLQQLLASGSATPLDSFASLLPNASAHDEAVACVLGLTRVPLRVATISDVVEADAQGAIDQLESRGLTTRSVDGVLAHDVLRRLTAQLPAVAKMRPRLVAALAASPEPRLAAEAARLLRHAGDLDGLLALLERRGAELLQSAQSTARWAVLSGVQDPRFSDHQFRTAAVLGSATVIDSLERADARSMPALLDWARVLYSRGDYADALATLESLSPSTLSDDQRSEASILRAQCHLERGEWKRARVALQAHGEDVPTRRALDIRIRAELGEPIADAAWSSLAEGQDPEVLVELAHACRRLQRAELAQDLLSRAIATPLGGDPAHLVGRRSLLLRARSLYEAGEWSRAEDLLDRLRPFVRAPSQSALEHGTLVAAVGLHAGRGAQNVPPQSAEASLLAMAIGHEPSGEAGGPWAALHAARWGRTSSTAPNGPVDTMALAVLAFLDGRESDVREAWSQAVRRARKGASQVAYLTCLATAIDLGTCLGAEVDAERQAFAEALTKAPSPRFEPYPGLWSERPLPSLLASLATRFDVAPMLARRARATLGYDAQLDQLDQAVVERLRGTLRLRVEPAPGGPWRSEWGADATRAHLWNASGAVHDLSKKPSMWQLAETLIRSGSASKETLVTAVWGEPEYHPLRHDARIHTGVRKLRELIERNPSEPEFIVTESDGYTVRGSPLWITFG